MYIYILFYRCSGFVTSINICFCIDQASGNGDGGRGGGENHVYTGERERSKTTTMMCRRRRRRVVVVAVVFSGIVVVKGDRIVVSAG